MADSARPLLGRGPELARIAARARGSRRRAGAASCSWWASRASARPGWPTRSPPRPGAGACRSPGGDPGTLGARRPTGPGRRSWRSLLPGVGGRSPGWRRWATGRALLPAAGSGPATRTSPPVRSDPDPAQAPLRPVSGHRPTAALAGGTQPLVLVLDDLHAADHASILLLDFLARELRCAAVLLVGCYRDVEAHMSPGGRGGAGSRQPRRRSPGAAPPGSRRDRRPGRAGRGGAWAARPPARCSRPPRATRCSSTRRCGCCRANGRGGRDRCRCCTGCVRCSAGGCAAWPSRRGPRWGWPRSSASSSRSPCWPRRRASRRTSWSTCLPRRRRWACWSSGPSAATSSRMR